MYVCMYVCVYVCHERDMCVCVMGVSCVCACLGLPALVHATRFVWCWFVCSRCVFPFGVDVYVPMLLTAIGCALLRIEKRECVAVAWVTVLKVVE